MEERTLKTLIVSYYLLHICDFVNENMNSFQSTEKYKHS